LNNLQITKKRITPTAKVITVGKFVVKTDVAVVTALLMIVAIVLVDIVTSQSYIYLPWVAFLNNLQITKKRITPTAKVITVGRLVVNTDVAVSTALWIMVAIVDVDI